jgi:hypothetical protein
MERAEFASTFRGKGSIHISPRSTFVGVCSDVVGAHPDVVLRRTELWDMLPNHLKDYVRNATRRHRASELQPVLLERIFLEDSMDVLNLDHFPGVTNTFLRTVCNRLDLKKLTSLSLVGNHQIHGKTVATLLRGCTNISYINFKGCIDLKNDTFPEKLVKELKQLTCLNVSFTRIGGKAIASIYSLCPKLSTLKLAGCNLFDGIGITKIFPYPSKVLTNLKIRQCTINQAQLQYILEQFPNLQIFDCSSAQSSTIRNIRPFINISHPSELRKLNLSNLPNLDLTKPVDLHKFFEIHTKLEHIYLMNANVNARLVIPQESLAKFKTLFVPGMSNSTKFLPAILEIAQNLTYLDLSRTNIRFDRNDYAEPLVFNVPHLHTLSLEHTAVNDDSAETISQIHTLRSLFLRNTAISSLGVRMVVYACPWLQEVDLSSCRSIAVRDRRTLAQSIRQGFWAHLAEARQKGNVLLEESENSSEWYHIKTFESEEEERDGLIRVPLWHID